LELVICDLIFIMIISLIVATSSNNVIGKDNKLPWHLPNDLKYFKNTTWAMPIVMGRKTFESIGKPLPGRTNIVITRNTGWTAAGVSVVNSIEEAVQLAAAEAVKEIFIIGGAEIFLSLLPRAGRIYLTRIHQDFEGDVFFPVIDEEEWKLIRNRDCVPDEKNKYAHSFQVWERKQLLVN
jgi:dihydrofolate reductase